MTTDRETFCCHQWMIIDVAISFVKILAVCLSQCNCCHGPHLQTHQSQYNMKRCRRHLVQTHCAKSINQLFSCAEIWESSHSYCLWWQTVRKCTHISLTVPSHRALRNGRNTFAFIRDVKPDCDVILYILLRFMHPKHLTNLNALFKNNRVLSP